MRSGISGKYRVCIRCSNSHARRLNRRLSGVLSRQAMLKALDRIIDLLIRCVAYVSDSEDRVFHSPQAGGNLYPKIGLKPSSKPGYIEIFGWNDARDAVSRLQFVNFHSRSLQEITDPFGDLRASRENLIHPLRLDKIQGPI